MKVVIPIVCLTILLPVLAGGTARAADEEFAGMEQQLQLLLSDQAIDLEFFPEDFIVPPMIAVEDPSSPTLTQFLSLMNWFAGYEGEDEREQAAEALGKLALYYCTSDRIQIDIMTGMHPDDVMENLLTHGLLRLGIEPAVAHLFDAYLVSRSARIRELIEESDPSLLEGIVDETPIEPMGLERRTDPVEAAGIIERWDDPNLSTYELSESMKRIAVVGGEDNVPIVITRLSAPDVPSLVKQNGLKALGELGGSEARAFLLDQLRIPMPAGAELGDYGATEAILRSQAVLALGRCGDESLIQPLTELSADEGQYERVREACAKAIGIIHHRLPEEGTGR